MWLITSALSLAILGPALVLVPRDGIDGAASAFLVGNVAAALVALGVHVQGRRGLEPRLPAAGAGAGLTLAP